MDYNRFFPLMRCYFRIFYVWMTICKTTFTDTHEVAVLVNIRGL